MSLTSHAEIGRVGRKDVGVSGELESVSVSWNAGLTAHDANAAHVLTSAEIRTVPCQSIFLSIFFHSLLSISGEVNPVKIFVWCIEANRISVHRLQIRNVHTYVPT